MSILEDYEKNYISKMSKFLKNEAYKYSIEELIGFKNTPSKYGPHLRFIGLERLIGEIIKKRQAELLKLWTEE